MLDTIAGLPIHPLIVHATVVIVPAAALAVALAALVPRFRRWAGILPLVLSALAVILTPLSTQSGESLEERVGESDLIETHSQLGEGLKYWVVLLFVGAALLYWVDRRAKRSARDAEVGGPGGAATPSTGQRVLAIVAIVVSLVAALGTTVQVVRIGHSGAQAAWSDVVESTNPPSGEGDADSD
jgi:uncharacterized membrane protein